MKRDELWKIYTEKNPSFNGDGNITMSAAGLRKLFNQTYEAGYNQGKVNAEAMAKLKAKDAAPKSPLDAFFRPPFTGL